MAIWTWAFTSASQSPYFEIQSKRRWQKRALTQRNAQRAAPSAFIHHFPHSARPFCTRAKLFLFKTPYNNPSKSLNPSKPNRKTTHPSNINWAPSVMNKNDLKVESLKGNRGVGCSWFEGKNPHAQVISVDFKYLIAFSEKNGQLWWINAPWFCYCPSHQSLSLNDLG